MLYKCIDATEADLTVGKIYEGLPYSDAIVMILNDDAGDEQPYFMCRFMEVERD